MSWVRWSNWSSCGMTQVGQMPARDVDLHIREFGKEAAKLLKETGADHVLYAVKSYGENDELEEVKFYQQPMTDAEFEEKVANIPGVIVYAHHAKRGRPKSE